MSERMVQIKESTARGLARLLEDINEIDSRSGCSDSYFRSHLMIVVNLASPKATEKELNDALEAASIGAEFVNGLYAGIGESTTFKSKGE